MENETKDILDPKKIKQTFERVYNIDKEIADLEDPIAFNKLTELEKEFQNLISVTKQH